MKREPAEPQGFIKLTGVGIPRLQAGEDVNIAGIAYPYGVKTADPDNAAETVNTILHSGTRIGAWPDVNSQHCRGVAFVRLPNLMTGNHMVRLFVFPVPENFQMAQSIAESSIDAWGEHDRRMR